jgi:hypothetical protein
LYAIALWNLIQNISADTYICIVENTTSEDKIENDKLKILLANPKITYKIFLNQNNLGSKNKGAGELQMCQAVLSSLGEKLNQYNWIIYYTSRHIMFDTEEIEKQTRCDNVSILISNPSYILSNKNILPVASGNYNDMLFAMRTPLFVEYCSNIDPEKLVREKMNSERYLFLFIEEKIKQKISIADLEEIPLIRYDYAIQEMHLVSNHPESYSNFNKVLKIYLAFYNIFKQSTKKTDSVKEKRIIISESEFKNYIYRLLGNLAFTLSQYKYNIEPTWSMLCKQLEKKIKIILPQGIETTMIYKNRINAINKIIWK